MRLLDAFHDAILAARDLGSAYSMMALRDDADNPRAVCIVLQSQEPEDWRNFQSLVSLYDLLAQTEAEVSMTYREKEDA